MKTHHRPKVGVNLISNEAAESGDVRDIESKCFTSNGLEDVVCKTKAIMLAGVRERRPYLRGWCEIEERKKATGAMQGMEAHRR